MRRDLPLDDQAQPLGGFSLILEWCASWWLGATAHGAPATEWLWCKAAICADQCSGAEPSIAIIATNTAPWTRSRH
jgi:hypothetical protein